MSGPFGSSQWMYNSGANFYNGQVTNSLRVNAGDTMTRAFGTSPTSSTTMSFGGWCKFTGQHYMNIFSATLGGSGVPQSFIQINGDLKILLQSWTGSADIFHYISTRVIRDTSAWMHLWVQIDTTDGTASDRVKLYVNGVRETVFDTAVNPSSGVTVVGFNQNYTHYFGHTNALYGIGAYLADWWFLDGQDVSPVDTVGEFKNGVFIPKEYSSPTFGNKGFHLEFKQTGTGTASSSTIGADTSGNANHFSSSGIVASDCDMPDSPENNFPTLNPLSSTGITYQEGNLEMSGSASYNAISTMGITEGKHYYEVLAFDNGSGGNLLVGIIDEGFLGTQGNLATNRGTYRSNGVITNLANTTQTSGSTYATGDFIGVAIDCDNGTVQFYKNNVAQGATPSFTFTAGTKVFANIRCDDATTIADANFGQDSSFCGNTSVSGNTDADGFEFRYTPPSGFKAICAKNLPEPTISPNADTQADDYFNTVLYTGTGSSNAITGVGFQPDWVWVKKRNTTARNHVLTDSSRGATKGLFSSLADGEVTNAQGLTSFDSDGFSVGTYNNFNESSGTYVAWNWKLNGGTTSSNTDGSITSTVQANTDAGFSIVTYTGTGGTATVGHGLGVKPSMLIVKPRVTANDWIVYFETLGAGKFLALNLGDPESSNTTMFNNTEPTTTVFSINTPSGTFLNKSGEPYVCYAFNSVDGYSKFGSYTGNSSSDGVFIYTGFRPAWFMVKVATGFTNNWTIYDNKTTTFNPDDTYLLANSSGAEVTANPIDFVSNGIKLRNSSQAENNSSGTYIYMAFAENPFKYANAR